MRPRRYALRTLQAAHHRPRAASNRAFHERIFQVNGNTVLTEIYGGLNYHVLIEHVFHTRGITDLPEVIAEHQAILEALAAHDPDAAEEAMRVHIERGGRHLLETEEE